MKKRSTALFLAGLIVTLPVSAEDWQTTDGKTYSGITVIKVEADAVTVLYKDGGALVPLSKLPPDLQKRFNYVPAKAEIAAQARAKADAENKAALAQERQEADTKKQAELVADDPRTKQAQVDAAAAARQKQIDDYMRAQAAQTIIISHQHGGVGSGDTYEGLGN